MLNAFSGIKSLSREMLKQSKDLSDFKHTSYLQSGHLKLAGKVWKQLISSNIWDISAMPMLSYPLSHCLPYYFITLFGPSFLYFFLFFSYNKCLFCAIFYPKIPYFVSGFNYRKLICKICNRLFGLYNYLFLTEDHTKGSSVI